MSTTFPPHGTEPGPPPPGYPFVAIEGQPALQQALLLVALDPAIGGLLVEGPRGSAKSTAARALAELLPGSAFVHLPLGASLEHLAGTLDLGEALAGHRLRFRPGLLARAHGGVLYVDEVNLLPDALVDTLLDAAASGRHTVERDGVSHSHAARFVLVGTMNPEEGALRPQLLDRFGLSLELQDLHDPARRRAAVRRRLAFDADPDGFRAQHAAAQSALAARLQRARQRLVTAAFDVDDAVADAVARACLEAGVEGLRADLAMLRAARALAFWEDAAEVAVGHVERVRELVLRHRRAPGTGPGQPVDEPAETAGAHGPDGAEGEEGEGGERRVERVGRPGRDGSKGGPQEDAASPAGNPGKAQAGAAATGDADWGELPAEPVGLAALRLAPAARGAGGRGPKT